jgi:hypothetical protein
VPRGGARAFIAERKTTPGRKLPLNTNGGGIPACSPPPARLSWSDELPEATDLSQQ